MTDWMGLIREFEEGSHGACVVVVEAKRIAFLKNPNFLSAYASTI